MSGFQDSLVDLEMCPRCYYVNNLCIPFSTTSGRQHLQLATTGTLLVPCTLSTGERDSEVSTLTDRLLGTVCHLY